MLKKPRITGEWESTVVGEQIVFIRMEYDTDTGHEYPFEDTEYGYIIHHNRSIKQGFDPEHYMDRRQHDKDAVLLSAYQHGQWLWWPKADAVTGARVPDMQWDGCWEAGLYIPSKAQRAHANAKHWKQGSPERQAYLLSLATSAAKRFTTWLNGEYFGYVVEIYTLKRDGEPLTEHGDYANEEAQLDSCWGFDDFDFAVQSAVEAADGMLAHSLL